MPQILQSRLLFGSALATLLLLGGAQAARQHLRSPCPKTESDLQYVVFSTALTLLHQDRGLEALALLRRQESNPLTLSQTTSLSSDLTPGAQIMMLSLNLARAAQEAGGKGEVTMAQAYLAQCRVLSRRIRSTPQLEDTMPQSLARSVEKVAERAELTTARL
ncbi:hypothetical protein [Armatimonas sp.]|uniref:hypothetical protein n=1 Tax=Armatimonas sp. TaxID=1872638 RepID=UPI00374D882E